VDVGPAEVTEALSDPGATIGTSRPAPAEFAAKYRELLAGGATGVVSVHLSRRLSGTWEAARVGADEVDPPLCASSTPGPPGWAWLRGAGGGRRGLDGSAGTWSSAAADVAAGPGVLLRGLAGAPAPRWPDRRGGGLAGQRARGEAGAARDRRAIEPLEKVRTLARATTRLVELAERAAARAPPSCRAPSGRARAAKSWWPGWPTGCRPPGRACCPRSARCSGRTPVRVARGGSGAAGRVLTRRRSAGVGQRAAGRAGVACAGVALCRRGIVPAWPDDSPPLRLSAELCTPRSVIHRASADRRVGTVRLSVDLVTTARTESSGAGSGPHGNAWSACALRNAPPARPAAIRGRAAFRCAVLRRARVVVRRVCGAAAEPGGDHRATPGAGRHGDPACPAGERWLPKSWRAPGWIRGVRARWHWRWWRPWRRYWPRSGSGGIARGRGTAGAHRGRRRRGRVVR